MRCDLCLTDLLACGLLACGLLACGSSTTAPPAGATSSTGSGGAGGGVSMPVCTDAAGSCNTVVCEQPRRSAQHVEPCEVVTYHTNPPTSGTHYSVWAQFKVYADPVPRGFYVHSMEHSGVVLAYNCDMVTDCPALVTELEQFRTDYGQDDLCDMTVVNRVIVTPDPKLDVPFAAAAWGYSLTGDCYDQALVQDFVDEHYGQNYENFCSGGVDPTDPMSTFPPDCGE